MKKLLILMMASLIACPGILAQLQVAITIDDVPNTKAYNASLTLVRQLDQKKVPTAIFINESKLQFSKNQGFFANVGLLMHWGNPPYNTLGNHTYSHLRYSAVGYQAFTQDLVKGEEFTEKLAKKYHKKLRYFRFPYNDLGKDSSQHHQIVHYLQANNYILTPFTVESSDWMFNYLYEHYQKQGKPKEAQRIGNLYIQKTLEYFTFFEKMAMAQYKRPVRHIYLCHDNPLNADYIGLLLSKLRQRKYSFISLTKAMQDPVYQQTDVYYKKWGVSWMYRWMKDGKARSQLMKTEPDIMSVYQEYQKVLKAKH
ncbi:polysaccharide deacetylase family protein [Microscilla marina]|uniref:Polysaccharide deacetylase domain protein n=1 Tax=Microscilla marina ATCC 23134 TaxID=313606 RepID=A1ZWR5_MICM2|nr:polysaccharide deacetylase family protein [Microscilla marina]EAY25197.1 polysaccharide deacetylase domain protein [Microscilla marina ATCC 23134]